MEDGVYTAEFDTDSSMFHVNEANDKKGKLIDVVHKGYKMKDKVVRYAKVVVGE